jgi:hypothetical protein
MRRESDRKEGQRTGIGRRARDRILAGQTSPSASIRSRYELANLTLFLADDLRESALAVGGIESFLLRAQETVEKPDLSAAELRSLVEDHEVVTRFELLWDAISSLRRSMALIHEALSNAD